MEAIMRTIDDKHVLYRTRAVQTAQFMLLSDGSVKSKINNLLRFYAHDISTKEDLYDDDKTSVYDIFQVYGQNYFDSSSLALPVRKRKPTPIDLMVMEDGLDLELVNEKNRQMMEYIKNAITSENVNQYAKTILNGKTAVSAGHVFEDNPDDLIKIIGLFTYQKSPDREYDIKMKDHYVECNGVRFKEFIVEGRKA